MMMTLKSVPLLLVALLCTWRPGIAQPFVPHVCPHTPAELQPVTERGRYIEEYDQAGWHATDAAFGRAPSPPPSVRMYVATKSSGRWTVYFGRMNDAKTAFIPAIVAVQQNASATFTAAPASDSSSIPSGLTGFALGIDSARSLFGPVSRPYNIALYPLADSSFYVYLYPAQIRADIYPIGGDERFHFSADGRTLLDRHRMHRAILDIPPGTAPAGSTLVGDMHNDLFSDMPEDTDVFHVLAQFRHPLPSYVSAQGVLYFIDTSGAIECKGSRPQGSS